MRTVSIKLKDMAIANIQLGFVGENNATQVIFESKEIFDENPYAVQLLVVTPPEGTSYEVTTARIGDNVIWNVSELDTAFEGDGSIQLVFTDGGQVIKTYNADTTVLESQVPSGTAPATALNWIQDAEAWAKGTRGGRAVEDDDPTYQNNSKYYSDKVVNMASDSEAWAKGTRDGEAVESDDPAYHNNSKYYAESIADTASDSEAYAAGTRGGEDVDEDDPAYENNAKYYNEQAALEKAAAQAAAETASAAYNVNLLAANYDATKTYAVGEYVIYNGGLYRCISAITTAEAWTAAHWSSVTVGKDTSALKSAIANYNSFDLLKDVATYVDRELREVTFTWSSDNSSCTVSGTATGGVSYTNLYVVTGNNQLPPNMVPGGRYIIHYKTTDSDIRLTFGIYRNGAFAYESYFTGNGVLNIPDDCTGIYIRLSVAEGKSATGVASDIAILTAYTNNELEELITNALPEYTHAIISNVLPNDGDANNYKDNTVYMVSAPNQIEHLPSTDAGVLITYKVYNFAFQFFTAHTASGDSHMYVRRCTLSNSTWTDWKEIGYGVKQTINQYSNTYNITASPSITTDTNNFLASTGDTTDRTADIITMLSGTGACHLGAGVFYVSGIDMPDDTTLEGCGSATEVILIGTDSTEGYAIKPGSRCTVRNMSIKGNTANHTGNNDYYPTSATYVNRHGLLWQGDFSTDNTHIPRRAIISGVCISNFTGGGITCVDTGTNVSASFSMSDSLIWYCYAGINIPYSSEYNRFANVAVTNCLYGTINNGGNNLFTNCNISNNNTAVWMDDTNSQSPNNSHGSFTGCAFNHNGQNNGYAFILNGLDSGEIFSGCQIFYGKTQITDCKGIRFVGCNFGRKTDISVSNSKAISYDACQFREATDTPVTNTSNTGFKFTNCMLYSGADFSPLT